MKGKLAAVLAIFSTVAWMDDVNKDTNVIQAEVVKKETRYSDPVQPYTLEENKAKIKYGINQIHKIEAVGDEVQKAKMKNQFLQEMGIDPSEFQKRFMSNAVLNTSTQANITPMEMPKLYGNRNLLNQLNTLEAQTTQPKAEPEFNNKARIANRPKMTYRA